MKIRSLNIHGLKQRLYVWGNPRKPKLFFFHGWLDTGAAFQFVAEHLQRDFYCLAPDMRGFGKSGHIRNPLGYFFYEYVADMHELFRQWSPRQAVRLVAHSLGGAVAAIYAGTFPERVSHLVNIEGYLIPRREPSVVPERGRLWLESLGKKRFRFFKTLEAFARRLQKSNPRLPWERALFLARHLGKRGSRGWTMAADPKHKLIEPYWTPLEAHEACWAKIEAKCLLVSVKNSEMAARFGAADFAAEKRAREAHFPAGTRVETISDCGHMVHHEKPEVLAELIRGFLGKTHLNPSTSAIE
ncbi:MAG TPA: alpha/beta hydrolase [Deltaproteobacteria bacterium]|nr:alpha/beta hydrolase [Deltaproteobacteria bacterium]